MKITELKKKIGNLFLSLFLTAQLMVLLDVAAVLLHKPLSAKKFAVCYLAVFLFLHFVPFITKKVRKTAVVTLLIVAVLAAMVVPCWYVFSQNAVYDAPDNGKAALYGNQNVMLFVPHQDDEINVMGGVLEEYVKYGSRVTVVFSTNGDKNGLAETRMQEAVDALAFIGIPAENIIFLGYGDKWQDGQPHIYNAESGAVLTSHVGRTETYGSAAYNPYREGAAYTRENFLQDIESVILEYQPDILYCVDYDHHIDHRALSLSFEKVLGNILAEHPELTASRAIELSEQMMDGYKADLFWLDLSFIGWIFLAAMTLNLGNLALNPYRNAARAAFYRQLQAEKRYTLYN